MVHFQDVNVLNRDCAKISLTVLNTFDVRPEYFHITKHINNVAGNVRRLL